MKSEQHRQAFSSTLSGLLLDAQKSLEAKNKESANGYYSCAFGLIAGAALSGGISPESYRTLSEQLMEFRESLIQAFGSAPETSIPTPDITT